MYELILDGFVHHKLLVTIRHYFYKKLIIIFNFFPIHLMQSNSITAKIAILSLI